MQQNDAFEYVWWEKIISYLICAVFERGRRRRKKNFHAWTKIIKILSITKP